MVLGETSRSPERISMTLNLRAVAFAAAALFALTPPAHSQNAPEYKPQVGQPGKDVIWVPTPQALVDRMLDMAKVTPSDFVVDLGSGDGRTVITAAKRGATAMGVEFNPDMAQLAVRNAEKEGVTARAKMVNGDIFATDFSTATVVTMYLLPSLNLKLRPTILNMKPGTRVVSHAFNMAEWEPDETGNADGYTAYLWIVPAKVAGRWRVTASGGAVDLSFAQTFQKLTGAASGGVYTDLSEATLRGDAIAFTLKDRSGAPVQFRGKVVGEKIEGTLRTRSGEQPWSATRQGS